MTVAARRSRSDLAARALELRAAGHSGREIAETLGISRAYAGELCNDPDGTRAKARKARYAQPCVDCGAPTSGSEGRREEPRCVACGHVEAGRTQRVWTRERMVGALHDARAVLGRDPAVLDFNPYQARALGDVGRAALSERMIRLGRWPWFTLIYREFGSYRDAMAAAGMDPRPAHGTSESWKRRRTA